MAFDCIFVPVSRRRSTLECMSSDAMTQVELHGWTVRIPGEGVIEIVDGVLAPLVVQAEGQLRDLPQGVAGTGEDARIRIEAVYEEEEETYLLRELSVTAPALGEVSGALLREVAPLRITRWVLSQVLQIESTARPLVRAWVSNHATSGVEGAVIEEAVLEDAADIYRYAEAVRDAPAKAVGAALGLQTRTATNWIKRARAQGLLMTREDRVEERRLQGVADAEAERDLLETLEIDRL